VKRLKKEKRGAGGAGEELESLRPNSRRDLYPREPQAKVKCTDVGSF
jgi:hypothetical protein